MKKMMFQGPSLTHVGINPLYNAIKPSVFTVCTRQSSDDVYIAGTAELPSPITVVFNFFWFIKRVCKGNKEK